MPEQTTSIEKLQDYKVFRLKFNESDEESSSHCIYVKKYKSEKKSQDKPVGKTLVVLNVPPYATEDSIPRVFSVAGDVARVSLIDSYKNEHKNKYQVPTAFFNDPPVFKFKIGFVVFKKSESLDVVLRCDDLPPLSTEEHPVLTGIAKWTQKYNQRVVNTEDMQKEVDQYMHHYDKVKKAEELNGDDEADDDGWVTVGKKGNNAGFQQKESVVSKLEQKLLAQKKKAKNLTNFYSFELRESKKQQLMDLRKKFEEDRSKMHSLKQNRKFKPY